MPEASHLGIRADSAMLGELPLERPVVARRRRNRPGNVRGPALAGRLCHQSLEKMRSTILSCGDNPSEMGRCRAPAGCWRPKAALTPREFLLDGLDLRPV